MATPTGEERALSQSDRLWSGADDGTWRPEAWSKSPLQLQEEARAMNIAAFARAARDGGRHSQPPAPPSYLRDL